MIPGAGRTERRVLGWMCVLIAVNQLGFGAVIPVLPLYAQSFGVSISAIGVTVAVYGLARVVLAMPAGRIADRLGRREALAIGGAVSALGNLWSAVAGSFPEFVIARFVSGAGAGLVLTAGVVVLADISTPANRGRTMAVYQGVFLFAVGIGPFPGGLLAEHAGLAAPFAAYAVAGALVGLCAWFGVPETRDLRADAASAGDRAGAPFREGLRAVLAHRGYVLACAVQFMNAFARTGARSSRSSWNEQVTFHAAPQPAPSAAPSASSSPLGA